MIFIYTHFLLILPFREGSLLELGSLLVFTSSVFCLCNCFTNLVVSLCSLLKLLGQSYVWLLHKFLGQSYINSFHGIQSKAWDIVMFDCLFHNFSSTSRKNLCPTFRINLCSNLCSINNSILFQKISLFKIFPIL